MLALILAIMSGWAVDVTPGKVYSKTSLGLEKSAFCRQYACKLGMHYVHSDSTTLEPLNIVADFDITVPAARVAHVDFTQRLNGVLSYGALTISAPLGSDISKYEAPIKAWAKLSGVDPAALFKACQTKNSPDLKVSGQKYLARCTASSTGANALVITASVFLP